MQKLSQSKPIPSKLKPTKNLRFSFGLKYHIGCLQRTNKAFKYCVYCYLKVIHINFKLDQNKANTYIRAKTPKPRNPKNLEVSSPENTRTQTQ